MATTEWLTVRQAGKRLGLTESSMRRRLEKNINGKPAGIPWSRTSQGARVPSWVVESILRDGFEKSPYIRDEYKAKTPVYNQLTDDSATKDKWTEELTQTKKGDTWSIDSKSLNIETVDELVEYCKVDLNEWEIDTIRTNSSQVWIAPRSVGSTKEGWSLNTPHPEKKQMVHISVTFKRKVSEVRTRKQIELMIEEAKKQLPVRNITPKLLYNSTGYMLEIPLYDPHFNKRSWGRETGGANYDLDIAVEVYNKAVATLVERSSKYKYERVFYILGGDISHTDNNEGTTTRGTKQDFDGRLLHSSETIRKTVVGHIEWLVEEVAPVTLVFLKGNHDYVTSMSIGEACYCWFHDSKYVTVDKEPRDRKYYKWGVNMIGLTHGDSGKPLNWASLMPVEEKKMWAETRWREVHAGHLHKDSLEKDEIYGVKVRRLPSLAPPDAWHAKEGYVTSTPSAEAFMWHHSDGLVGTSVYNHVWR